MRRALLSKLPALSRMGINPWDVPRLTKLELDQYLQQMRIPLIE